MKYFFEQIAIDDGFATFYNRSSFNQLLTVIDFQLSVSSKLDHQIYKYNEKISRTLLQNNRR
jgi:hypothetical protein